MQNNELRKSRDNYIDVLKGIANNICGVNPF